ncbi:MAG: hypothetical protein ABII06_00385 [Pseudomonadota bacterium]
MKTFEKRFGMTAVAKGYITLEQLIEAMKTQVSEDVDKATHRLIGEILVEMGFITPAQIIEVLDAMDIGMAAQGSLQLRE